MPRRVLPRESGTRTFAELLIDCEEDRVLRAVLVGMVGSIQTPMPDFVLRDWRLDAGEGDQAPLHVHHRGEEAFICLDGDLEVEVDGLRHDVEPGTFIVVPRGAVHTFATRRGAHVLAVMSPEIAELIDRLHEPMSTGGMPRRCGVATTRRLSKPSC